MPKIAFVCDSATVLPPGFEKEIDCTVVPLSIIKPNGEVYEDSEESMPLSRLAAEIESGIKHKTSVTPIGKVIGILEKLSETHDQIVWFPLSKNLSSQYAQLRPLEQDFLKLKVIDTNDACLSLGFLMLDARRAMAAGKTVDDVQKMAYDRDKRRTTYFIPGDTKGLVASGRVPKLAGMLADKVKLRVIIKFKTAIETAGMSIGTAEAIKKMVKAAAKEYSLAANQKFKRLFIYAGLALAETKALVHKALHDELGVPLNSTPEVRIPAVVLSHTLKNTIGIFVEVE